MARCPGAGTARRCRNDNLRGPSRGAGTKGHRDPGSAQGACGPPADARSPRLPPSGPRGLADGPEPGGLRICWGPACAPCASSGDGPASALRGKKGLLSLGETRWWCGAGVRVIGRPCICFVFG